MLEEDAELTTRVEHKTDEDGYLGRECPSCNEYFKVKFTRQFVERENCFCPYCKEQGTHGAFYMKAQLDFVLTQGVNQLKEALYRKLAKDKFISSIELADVPVRNYQEEKCETNITCSNCQFEYAVYGVFACCPQCSQENTLNILSKNIEVVHKLINLAEPMAEEEAQELLESALNKLVSKFEGFGKRLQAPLSNSVSFQNLLKAREKLLERHGIDMVDGLTSNKWQVLTRAFQKRHVYQHNSGVADNVYLQFANDDTAILGRKVKLTADEVRSVADTVEQLGIRLEKAFTTLGKE